MEDTTDSCRSATCLETQLTGPQPKIDCSWGKLCYKGQWHNGGKSAPQKLLIGKFLLTYREKREKGWKLRRKGGKLEMEVGKCYKKRRGLFFFAFHFWKQWKFVLGLPKWEFSTRKKHFILGKKSGKITLPPQKNMPVTPLIKGWIMCLLFTYPLLHWIPGLSSKKKGRNSSNCSTVGLSYFSDIGLQAVQELFSTVAGQKSRVWL